MPTVIGLFRSSYELEKAVQQLMSQRFQGSQMRVVPMQETEAAPKPKGFLGFLSRGGLLGDTLDRSDGTSVMDGTCAGATVGGLAGVIMGAAVLPGPVALGVAGILGGGLLGFLVDRIIPANRRQEYAKALRMGSTLLHVRCLNDREVETAALILKENQAHEVGRIDT
jgi:uncharacterized protein YcfJ